MKNSKSTPLLDKTVGHAGLNNALTIEELQTIINDLQIENARLQIDNKKLQKRPQTSVSPQPAQNEKYSYHFYSNPLPQWIYDIKTQVFLEVNNAAINHYGYSREEFLEMSVVDIRPPEDIEIFLEVLRDSQINKLIHQGVWRHLKKNGNLIYVEITSYNIEYEGKPAVLVMSNDITDRKKSEDFLRNSEMRFRSLIEKGSAIIALHDREGKILYMSPSIQQALGYEPEKRIGEIAFEFIHPDDKTRMKTILAQLIANPGGSAKAQWRHQHANGSWHWMEGAVTNLLNDPGVNAVMHNFRDITTQKDAENKIILEKELSESIINSLPGIFYLYNESGKFLRWNRNFEKISGYSTEEVSRMHPLDFFDVNEKGILKNKIDEVFSTGSSEIEAHFFTKKGETLPYLFTGRTAEFENKLCLIGMGIDISDRKEAENKIRDNEEKIRLIMNASLDAIICIDTKGCITFWNPQAEIIFGWKVAEVKGRRLSEIIIPELYRNRHDKGMDNYLKTGKGPVLNILLELSAINREGKEFHIELTVLPIKQYGEEFFCAFIRDITTRKKGQDAIRISNERFHLVAKATNDSIWDWDLLTNKVTRDGKKLETLFGYEGWDATEVDFFWNKMAHPEDWEKVTLRRNTILENRTENYWEDEYRFLRSNGEYAHVHDKGYIIRNNDGKAIRMIGASQDITERKKAEDELKEKNIELKRLSAYLQSVREEERKYLAREVHDELGQLASALKIDIDWLNIKVSTLGDAARKRIAHANKTIEILIASVRQIASALRPSVLDDFGLNAALHWQCTEFQNLNGIQCIFSPGFDDGGLSVGLKTELFRIAQESLTNVMRHAKADKVSIRTKENSECFYLYIIDNGQGFNVEQSKNTLGLIGLRERAVSLGGKLEIESQIGKGTTISAIVPKK